MFHFIGLAILCVATLLAQSPAFAQQQPRATRTYVSHCTICHGGDGNGTERAPAILGFVASHSDAEITTLVRTGRPERGMPRFDFQDDEIKTLLAHLHGLATGTVQSGPARGGGGRGAPPFQPHPVTLKLTDGRTLAGTLTSQTAYSATLLTPDGRFHLLSRNAENYTERAIDPKQDWTSYDGNYTGNRYSRLEQINTGNAQRLAPAWIFPIQGAPRLEVTPVVLDGVMYITGPNEAYALDAVSGRQIWSFRTPRTPGLLSEAGGGANRGVAISGERVFMVTDNAHLLALDRRTGRKLWDITMADAKEGYSATASPLAIGDMVLSGIAGGEEGARGFVDAYEAATGKRVWRFWSIPLRGEKGSETWVGNALEHGCGATWLTGSYDPDLATVYWAVGNPCPDYNGDERKGDNLYTSSVVALDVKTGQKKWHFQFTPHDLHDWDAVQPILLVDEQWEGRPRKLLLHGDRNGFFFVLDRTSGELLLAKPMSKVTWATGYGKDGRPIMTEHFESTFEGALVCPGVGGGANWPAASFDPISKLFFVRVTDGCAVYKKNSAPIEVGERFFGGTAAGEPGGQTFIRAIDIHTGQKVWDYAMPPGGGGSGTLATAGGLLFFGEPGGVFNAVESKTGKPVWHFESGQPWRASPMTYMVGGKQYVVLAGTGGIFSFALVN
jgi:alcohol dehydrogenase (cytochrome c)